MNNHEPAGISLLDDPLEIDRVLDAVLPDRVRLDGPDGSGPSRFLDDGAGFFLVAETGDENGEPIGFAWGVNITYPNGRRVTYLHQLDVVVAHRRRGVGTALVERAMSVARTAGATKFWLSTGGHNTGAQALYERLGGDRKELGDVNFWWDLAPE